MSPKCGIVPRVTPKQIYRMHEIIRSALLRLRGTRRMKNKKCNMKEIDIEIETEVARIL